MLIRQKMYSAKKIQSFKKMFYTNMGIVAYKLKIALSSISKTLIFKRINPARLHQPLSYQYP